MKTSELNREFGIAGAVQFVEQAGGLTQAIISAPAAEGAVYLQGAHVSHWKPAGQRPVLFMSSRSELQPGQPIRGGVPVAFPWFGACGGGLAGPRHGFARIAGWTVEGTELKEDGAVVLSFALGPNELSRSFGYDAFHLRFRATFGAVLEMEFEVRNDSATPLTYDEALHTYFAVADIAQVTVDGLDGTTYLDETDGGKRKRQDGTIRFTGETDQLHVNTRSTCVITDAAAGRRIVVEKTGSEATTVWNPWIAKCGRLADMAPEDWREMVCVETVNAVDNAVTLPAGGSHTMTAVIHVE